MKLINPLIILRILSTILLIESISYLFCLPVAIIYGDSIYPFIFSSLAAILLYVLFRLSSLRADMTKASNRDTYLAVTLSWLVLTAMGTLPYIFSGTIPSFINAFFESTSGFTTTGASILTDVEALPYSILFWRSFTHWIGGLGIIMLIIIILPSLGITGQQLFSLESSLKEKIHPKIQAIGFRIMFIYFGLTIAQVFFLYLGDMTVFDSICYSFGTIATGGFSTRNTGLVYYSSYNQYIITIFMFLAGVSFVVYYYLVKRQFNKVRKNEELWLYTGTVLGMSLLAAAILFFQADKPMETAFRDGFFQVVSFITTTGFANTDYLDWPVAGILLLFVLFFAGACTGSSTGSIKMARHLLAIKSVRGTFTRLVHPNVVTPVKITGKPVPEKSSITVISFIVLYLFIFILGTLIVVLSGPDLITAASAVAASLGNVGPGMGAVGPMLNYAGLPEFSKVVFSILMIIGRLEILTVFALFSKSFWRL